MCQVLSEKHMTPKPISVLWRDNAQNSPSSSLQTQGAVSDKTVSLLQIKSPMISPGLNCAPFQFHFLYIDNLK